MLDYEKCVFNPKTAVWPLLWFFRKCAFQESVESYFSVAFNIIISDIFCEYFIEIPQLFQKI